MLILLVAALALTLAACGGDDDGGASQTATAGASLGPSTTASKTPAPSKSPTPTPGPTTAAPTPVGPTLAPGVKNIGSGTINFVLAPNGQFPIDGVALIQPPNQPPPCAAFVFAFSWQITNPNPPGDRAVFWQMNQQGVITDVASGPDGAASVGCGQLIAFNKTSDPVTVSVYYVQGATQ